MLDRCCDLFTYPVAGQRFDRCVLSVRLADSSNKPPKIRFPARAVLVARWFCRPIGLNVLCLPLYPVACSHACCEWLHDLGGTPNPAARPCRAAGMIAFCPTCDNMLLGGERRCRWLRLGFCQGVKSGPPHGARSALRTHGSAAARRPQWRPTRRRTLACVTTARPAPTYTISTSRSGAARLPGAGPSRGLVPPAIGRTPPATPSPGSPNRCLHASWLQITRDAILKQKKRDEVHGSEEGWKGKPRNDASECYAVTVQRRLPAPVATSAAAAATPCPHHPTTPARFTDHFPRCTQRCLVPPPLPQPCPTPCCLASRHACAAPCPKCQHRGAYFQEIQTRSADEPATLFFRCVKCAHNWKEG